MLFRLLYILHDRSKDERGAVAAEYAVLLALIAVVLAATATLLTGAIVRAFSAAIKVLPA
jgi:Flp pilus assembly pilin Flp